MLSSNEQEYIKSLIDTYFSYGYKSYVLVSRRVTYYTDDFEYFLYLSSKDISCVDNNTFNIVGGCVVKIDTSVKNNNNDNNNLVVESFSGVLHTDVAEFVYTNAKAEYNTSTEALNPDLFLGGDVNYEKTNFTYAFMFIIVCAVLVAYLFKLFKG